MKKTLSILCFLLCSSFAFSQGFFTYIDRSTQFFETLNENKFKEAQLFFDPSLYNKIKPESLEAMWKQITAGLGKFESVEGAQNKSQDSLQSVILDCKFAYGSQPFQFVYNNNAKMIGFFIVPVKQVPQYKPATYSDSSKYKASFINIKSGNFDLPGMLTLPKSGEKFPLVIFVHGSGPSDMDETVGQHKPFKDLAEGLAMQGIASIRYVKRTMLYGQSFVNKSYTLKEEVEDDLQKALEYAQSLPEIDKSKIYIFGHSLGGMVAPRFASQHPELKGIILAAAPARAFGDIAVEQYQYLEKASQDTSAQTKKIFAEAIQEAKKGASIKTNALPKDTLAMGLPISYWLDLNSLNQVATAKKLKNRILVIQGGNDYQVTLTDYNLWKSALKGKNVTFKLYPMLNHLFSFVSEKGTGAQYQEPGNVEAVLVTDLANWILEEK
ncbi:alpha/beta hydrolase fold protein [Pseudopedobacter saltans DSM 12145]|uniref:Alpha/beta hydrolase fold protein n=1 Tax=Pseudopedobacter saltans (strain ATCC 51119 / DSM 12145 / JCM 21818 / CCUG 39354 / LMG 10337 / NBRC 100064 / NCIMB 13643) TaxID=762903 RepID=F0S9L8_PSESL|nr:alpha/beta fold hydrolase [Pseudopedobacter saltans]ADY53571.1 alpha/beta hydrolase fold protein [Pseudopedobacter saltans DSM 12145]